jgi:hypothetical protein
MSELADINSTHLPPFLFFSAIIGFDNGCSRITWYIFLPVLTHITATGRQNAAPVHEPSSAWSLYEYTA